MRVIERDEVTRRLTYEACIPIVRQAMIDFSNGGTRQLLRSIIPLADGRLFGIMPGALGESAAFGAKLISVYPENFFEGPSVPRRSGRSLRAGNGRAGVHSACRRNHRHSYRGG